jgi:Secretion system C-terminal sorting domain
MSGWGAGPESAPFSGPFGISISGLPAAEAGTSVGADFCENTSAADLFMSITGQSSNTGTWYNPSVGPGNDVPSMLDLAGVPAGTYPFFYVIDNGACGYDEVETAITIVEGPSAGMDNTVTACNSGDIYLLQHLNGFPYSGGTWSDDDATGALVNGIFLSNMFVNGTYDFTYTVTGTSGCPDASATVTVNLNDCVGLGIADNATNVLSVYPNPVSEVLTIQNLTIATGVIDVLDVQGKIVKSIQVSGITGNYSLDMNALESGIYVVRISTEESVQEVRVVKQ